MDVLRYDPMYGKLAGPHDTVSDVPIVQDVKVRMECQHSIASHHSLRDSFTLYMTQRTSH
jgi:hypothetical protein